MKIIEASGTKHNWMLIFDVFHMFVKDCILDSIIEQFVEKLFSEKIKSTFFTIPLFNFEL